jgi:hypothetical protein
MAFQRTEKIHYGTLGLLALGGAYMVYLWLRLWAVPMTVDEGYTIMTYVPKSWRAIVLYDYNEISANNHILNTLWIKAVSGIFGMNLLTARSANLLGGLLYVVSGAALVRHLFRDGWTQCAALVLWLAHPTLTEFFGVARGYGLSFGLIGATLWAAVVWLQSNRLWHFVLAILCAWLAVAANFAVLYFYLLLSGIMAWQVLRTGTQKLLHLSILGLFGGLLGAFLYNPIRQIRKEGTFEMFGKTGFYEDFARSFARYFFRSQEHWGEHTFRDGVIVAGVICSLGVLFWALKFLIERGRWSVHSFLLVVCSGTLAINVAATLYTDATWLTGRTTLFFYPLLIATLWALLSLLATRWRWMAAVFVTLLALAWGANFRHNANVRDVLEWDFDRETYRVLDHLKALHQRENRQKPLRFGCFWLFNPSFTFHLKHGPQDWGRYIQPNNPPWAPLPDPKDSIEFFYATKDQRKDLDSLYEVAWEVHAGERFVFRRRAVSGSK